MKQLQFPGHQTLILPSNKLKDLIANPSKDDGPFLFRPLGQGWIGEFMMKEPGTGRKVRAAILCIVTNGKDVFYVFPDEYVDGLGSMATDIYPNFRHNGDGFRPNKTRFGARAKNRKRRT